MMALGITLASSVMFPSVNLADTPLAEYQIIINEQAGIYGLDPALVAAVIMVESGGNPDAVNSKSKATGLMQVMPVEAGELFRDRPSMEQLKDPELNISWGCSIMSDAFWSTHSEWGALYRFSGGSYWETKYGSDGAGMFTSLYWCKIQEHRKKIRLTSQGKGSQKEDTDNDT